MSANTTNTTVNATSKVWFITGASRGFGLELTRAALARGDRVVATARRPETITAALGEHANLLGVALDVTSEAQAIAAAGAAVARFGRIDVLVNNAGYGLLGAVEEASAQEVEQQFATNVFGVLTVTRAVLPQMRRQRSGRILNISSIGGYAAYPGWGVYGATKFAVEGLTEALHAELAPLGIHATAVEPGYFRTDFLENASLAVSPRILDDYAASAGQVREAARRISLNQPGDPQRLAQAMLALVESAHPPLRLPLGTDTLQTIRDKHAFVEAETSAWQALAASTDFPQG